MIKLMLRRKRMWAYYIIKLIIASIWLVNGLFCKVLNLTPRHQQIVATIIGIEDAAEITFLIGCAEIGMAAWIISGIWSRLNVVIQIVIIGAMNLLEFFLAANLLLWGRWNLLFALLLMLTIFYNRFHLLKPEIVRT